jgi:hypothetical protein
MRKPSMWRLSMNRTGRGVPVYFYFRFVTDFQRVSRSVIDVRERAEIAWTVNRAAWARYPGGKPPDTLYSTRWYRASLTHHGTRVLRMLRDIRGHLPQPVGSWLFDGTGFYLLAGPDGEGQLGGDGPPADWLDGTGHYHAPDPAHGHGDRGDRRDRNHRDQGRDNHQGREHGREEQQHEHGREEQQHEHGREPQREHGREPDRQQHEHGQPPQREHGRGPQQQREHGREHGQPPQQQPQPPQPPQEQTPPPETVAPPEQAPPEQQQPQEQQQQVPQEPAQSQPPAPQEQAPAPPPAAYP